MRKWKNNRNGYYNGPAFVKKEWEHLSVQEITFSYYTQFFIRDQPFTSINSIRP